MFTTVADLFWAETLACEAHRPISHLVLGLENSRSIFFSRANRLARAQIAPLSHTSERTLSDMDLDPRLLRYFLAVTKELHFGRAAGRLYVSQSALSESIKRLELQLGVQLFVRGPRRVELTEAGRVLEIQAPEVLHQIDSATAHVLAAALQENRQFRVGYSPFLDLDRVEAIRAKAEQRSDWQVEFVGERTTKLVQMLVSAHLSAALVIGPVIDKHISFESLFREKLSIGLSLAHRLANSETIRLAELAKDGVIWIPRSFNSAFYDWFVDRCQRLGYRPQFAFEVTTLQECFHLVTSRKGIMFATQAAQLLAPSGVVFRPLVEALAVETGLVYPEGAASNLLSEFIAIARSAFAEG